MDEHAQLRALLDLAESIGIEVRRAPPGEAPSGERPGGALVRLRDREILFLDPAASPADRIAVAAAALAGRSRLEDVFLPPEIRERIERAGRSD
jgi:hypothetical protein